MSESQKARVDRILEKLARVRDRGLECFGSESHGFRLNEPTKESTLADFESRHGIELPADFRAFLKYAGNGGAGPYYGIYPLEKWNDFLEWVVDDPSPGLVALPCPLYPGLRREDDWEDKIEAESPYQGTISIGSQGCTYAMQLVVSGQYAGRVVYVDADGQPPYMVRNADFLQWYERWLDELLGGYDLHWFGFGLGGTEEDLLRILDDSATSETDRVEAVQAIGRLAKLSEPGRQRVKTLLSDFDEEVRAAACRAVRTCEVPDAEQTVSSLLDDSSPAVRNQAVTTLMEASATRWWKRVSERLWDDDGEVATTAYLRLDKAGRLDRDVLLRIINESVHGALRYYAAHGMEWKEEDEQLLIALLRDDHPQVRFSATLGLRKLESTASLPTAIEILDGETDDHVIASILRMLGELGGEDAKSALLAWTGADDDFHRLDAVDGLCKLGDDRVAPTARELLKEKRSPERRDAMGLLRQSHAKSIDRLVTVSLKSSPNRTLRKLPPGKSWWPW